MKLIWLDHTSVELLVTDHDAFLIFSRVEPSVNIETFLGGGVPDQLHDDFECLQGLGLPVSRDVTEQPIGNAGLVERGFIGEVDHVSFGGLLPGFLSAFTSIRSINRNRILVRFLPLSPRFPHDFEDRQLFAAKWLGATRPIRVQESRSSR